MIGPGKYDTQCTWVRKELQAEGVILLVIGGKHGAGFSVQASLKLILELPRLLRDVADEIEKRGVAG
ncbi:hypothetical protein [Bradyrhizobium sp.]|uniref:hypothetical protein n=1 Tax=Bradyrhizobium sp. TaxID=376 RepID=UPI003C422E26